MKSALQLCRPPSSRPDTGAPLPFLGSYPRSKGNPDAELSRPPGEIHGRENLRSIRSRRKLVLVRPIQVHSMATGSG